jgi:hypothetical protein
MFLSGTLQHTRSGRFVQAIDMHSYTGIAVFHGLGIFSEQ